MPMFCMCPGFCFQMVCGHGFCPRVAAGWRAVPRSAARLRGGPPSRQAGVRAGGLVEAGREYGDLGFPGDGCLGGGGVREFRAGFLGAF